MTRGSEGSWQPSGREVAIPIGVPALLCSARSFPLIGPGVMVHEAGTHEAGTTGITRAHHAFRKDAV